MKKREKNDLIKKGKKLLKNKKGMVSLDDSVGGEEQPQRVSDKGYVKKDILPKGRRNPAKPKTDSRKHQKELEKRQREGYFLTPKGREYEMKQEGYKKISTNVGPEGINAKNGEYFEILQKSTKRKYPYSLKVFLKENKGKEIIHTCYQNERGFKFHFLDIEGGKPKILRVIEYSNTRGE